MTLKVHMTLQGLLVAAQPLADPLIKALVLPPEWAEVVHAALAAGNLLLAWSAHQHNTDGTPQTTAFVKPEK